LTTVGEADPAIVITEGEYDAMAVHQETGFPAVSLPNGAHNFPNELLPYFDRFERIYLWLDSDGVGQQAAKKFAQKLGITRTLIIDMRESDPKGPKDANDALRQGYNLQSVIRKGAKPVNEKNIQRFADL